MGADNVARICAHASGGAQRALDDPQQQRDADQEQEGTGDAVQDRYDGRQRLPDGEQIEVDRAGFNGGAVERGHRGQNPCRNSKNPVGAVKAQVLCRAQEL
jgi:hypothetical protein